MGQDHQHFLAVGQRLVHQSREGAADAVREVVLPLTVGAFALAVGLHPRLIIGVVLHLDVVFALEAAEAHLLQVLHDHKLCLREEHPGRLGRPLQWGDIDHLRVDVGPAQLAQALRRERDVALALIALLGVVFGQAVTQQIDQH